VTKEFILPDLLEPGLRLVFCGSGASARSASDRAYYAHPGNLFWPTIHFVGLTPYQFAPAEYPKLLKLDIGLTDVVKFASGSDKELPENAWDGNAIREKISSFAPSLVGFTSKAAARAALSIKKVEYGLMSEILGVTRFYVLPSPSGRARSHWDKSYWQQLAIIANE